MSEPPKPPWETAALELGKLDYSLDFGKRCEIIQQAAEAYAAQQTATLRAERDALKARLSSRLCSAHQEPDPLNCPTCDIVGWLESANRERAKTIDELRAENAALAASVARLREALQDASECLVLLGDSEWIGLNRDRRMAAIAKCDAALATAPPPAEQKEQNA
jgi:cell division protein FtsB